MIMPKVISEFVGRFHRTHKPVEDPLDGIVKKTPRDYALVMHGMISDLPDNISKDETVDCLMRLIYPGKHIHANPKKKQRQQQTDIAA